MRTGRPKKPLTLSLQDRERLESLANRARFVKGGLEALYDEPRPGTPRKVSDEQVEKVVIQTLESTPRGQTHWSTRGLAKAF